MCHVQVWGETDTQNTVAYPINQMHSTCICKTHMFTLRTLNTALFKREITEYAGTSGNSGAARCHFVVNTKYLFVAIL